MASLSEYGRLCTGGLPDTLTSSGPTLSSPPLHSSAAPTSSASQTPSHPHQPWAGATAGLGETGEGGSLRGGRRGGWPAPCDVGPEQLEGEEDSTRTPRQRDFPLTLAPAWGCCRLRLPSVSPQKPPLPAAHPLPTHMTMTCCLTPPPLPQGGQAATCLHPTLGHDGPRTREREEQLQIAWFPTDGVKLRAPYIPSCLGRPRAATTQCLTGSHAGCTRLRLGTPCSKPRGAGLSLQFRRPCSENSFQVCCGELSPPVQNRPSCKMAGLEGLSQQQGSCTRTATQRPPEPNCCF